MERYESVCPVEYAGGLDIGVRKWVQNPAKILQNHVKEGMVVLELGCGSGYFTTEIARMVGKSGKVIAADLQEGMLDIVSKKIKGTEIESRIVLHKCENDSIGFKGKVDLVLAFIMFHEVADKRKALEEIQTMLKPDGRLYVIEFKMHPPKKSFNNMVRIANDIGLREIERPRFLLCRAILLENR